MHEASMWTKSVCAIRKGFSWSSTVSELYSSAVHGPHGPLAQQYSRSAGWLVDAPMSTTQARNEELSLPRRFMFAHVEFEAKLFSNTKFWLLVDNMLWWSMVSPWTDCLSNMYCIITLNDWYTNTLCFKLYFPCLPVDSRPHTQEIFLEEILLQLGTQYWTWPCSLLFDCVWVECNQTFALQLHGSTVVFSVPACNGSAPFSGSTIAFAAMSVVTSDPVTVPILDQGLWQTPHLPVKMPEGLQGHLSLEDYEQVKGAWAGSGWILYTPVFLSTMLRTSACYFWMCHLKTWVIFQY